MSDSTGTSPDVSGLVVGILGGTGDQGRGLARRLARAGSHVVLGSRDGRRAAEAAADMSGAAWRSDTGSVAGGVIGTDNETCAQQADVVVVAVPYAAHAELLDGLRSALAGKVVVDCVNPLGFDDRGAYQLPVAEGSACQQAQALLPDSRVVGAFHHVSAVLLLDDALDALDGDVLVVGDDRPATDLARALVARVPRLRGVYAGRLRNAGQVEALTANLISVNRRYRTHAGIRLTGVAEG